jgi:hypothetical protein
MLRLAELEIELRVATALRTSPSCFKDVCALDGCEFYQVFFSYWDFSNITPIIKFSKSLKEKQFVSSTSWRSTRPASQPCVWAIGYPCLAHARSASMMLVIYSMWQWRLD